MSEPTIDEQVATATSDPRLSDESRAAIEAVIRAAHRRMIETADDYVPSNCAGDLPCDTASHDGRPR